MPLLSVNINGREYRVACDDGQEARLKSVANYVDQRVNELASSVGQVGESRLLVMASLLIADELSDARKQAAQQNGQGPGEQEKVEAAAAEALEYCAQRLEDIAARLERP